MNVLRGRRTHREEIGASAVEYGLLISLIAAVIVTATFLFGGMVKAQFTHTCEAYQEPTGGSAACE
jgi:pilus assembly protein Flp/PilA